MANQSQITSARAIILHQNGRKQKIGTRKEDRKEVLHYLSLEISFRYFLGHPKDDYRKKLKSPVDLLSGAPSVES